MVNDEKLNIRTAMVCPVRDCVTVCDTVVMQVRARLHSALIWALLLAAARLSSPSPNSSPLPPSLFPPLPSPTQNFFPADAVIAFAELLAAWKPAVAGC